MFKKYFISNNLTKSQIDLVKKFNKSSNIKYEKISKCEICFSSNFNILFHNDRYCSQGFFQSEGENLGSHLFVSFRRIF